MALIRNGETVAGAGIGPKRVGGPGAARRKLRGLRETSPASMSSSCAPAPPPRAARAASRSRVWPPPVSPGAPPARRTLTAVHEPHPGSSIFGASLRREGRLSKPRHNEPGPVALHRLQVWAGSRASRVGPAALDVLCPAAESTATRGSAAARSEDEIHRCRVAGADPRHPAASPFHGEEHRKIWARLPIQDIRTSQPRVLRLMRENQLLAPQRQLAPVAEQSRAGSIVTSEPNQMRGTDTTATVTLADGQVTVFAAVDHCAAECIGIHAVKRATRFEALEPLRQGVREYFGAFGPQAAAGLRIRRDHGSQYMSNQFQQELRFLGMESSPAFVREPEGNGCIERFFRTLKEQLLWVRHFQDLEELRLALRDFRDRYNPEWLIERLRFQSPRKARERFLAPQQSA